MKALVIPRSNSWRYLKIFKILTSHYGQCASKITVIYAHMKCAWLYCVHDIFENIVSQTCKRICIFMRGKSIDWLIKPFNSLTQQSTETLNLQTMLLAFCKLGWASIQPLWTLLCSTWRFPQRFLGFLDQNFSYKSVSGQSQGLVLIPTLCTGRKFVPIEPALHSLRIQSYIPRWLWVRDDERTVPT